MPHDLPDKPKIPNPEILSWKDLVYPALYIIGLLILAFFIWKLLSPFIAVALTAIIAYVHFLRDIFKKKH